MKEAGLDSLLLTKPANMFYITDEGQSMTNLERHVMVEDYPLINSRAEILMTCLGLKLPEAARRVSQGRTGVDGRTCWPDEPNQVKDAVDVLQGMVEPRRLEAELEQRNRDLTLLYHSSQLLMSTLELQQVLEWSIQMAVEITGAQFGSVWLWDQERPGELVCRAAFQLGVGCLPPEGRARSGQGVVGWVAQTGQGTIIRNAAYESWLDQAPDHVASLSSVSLMAVPLRNQSKVIGVLEAVNKHGGDFDAHDLSLVETLASTATIAIENSQFVETQRQLALALQVQNEDLEAFAHTVAHDLKSPLHLIVGYASAMVDDVGTLTKEEIVHHLRHIEQAAFKMDNMINELLLLAEVGAGRAVGASLDMAGVVTEAVQRLTLALEEYDAELVLPDMSAWPAVLGHAPWIEEVWVNYLTNALKYGGRPPRVELGAEVASGHMVRFWVRDNGLGLSPEEQTRLFRPFVCLRRQGVSGNGLGLSIVRRIVEKLGGYVQTESQVGQGSVFSFALRAADGDA